MDLQTLTVIAAAFFTAALSAVLGMGGGILLLAVMGIYFPPAVLIPLHGAVQLASNFARAVINWRAIAWRILGPMAAGCVLGAAVGSQLVLAIPEAIYQGILGVFILLMTWLPPFRAAPRVPGKFFWLGGISTALSMVVGATGALTAPFFLNEGLDKKGIIATRAGGMALTHLLKVGVFGLIGFQFARYWLLFAGMVVAVTLGTLAGNALLGRIPERTFVVLFRVVITLLALRMLLAAVWG